MSYQDAAEPNLELPLTGTRVVDLTSNIAAPFAGAILADLGAEVIHVESRLGDDSRRMSPRVGAASAYWHVVNRNKRVLQLDIRESDDRAELDRLLAEADVFLTNLRPAKLLAHRLDPVTLLDRFPRLVHGGLSAYGAMGEERDRAGYDAVLQARTGIAEVTGTADGPPVRAGVSVLDVGSGTWLALGVISALLRRERTGRGGAIATSLFETGANWVAYHVAAHQISQQPSGRHGSGHPAFSPYGIFATSDGEVCLGIGGDLLFGRLCEALGVPEMAEEPRFARNVDRVAHREALDARLAEILGAMTALEVRARLDAAGVACDIVQKPEGLLADPQAAATGMMVFEELPDGSTLTYPGMPLTFDGYRPSIRMPADQQPAGA